MKLKSDDYRNKVFKAGFGYTIGNYLIKGLSFLSLPLFTRMMNTSDYGIYNSFCAYSGFLYVIVGFAIHSSYRNAELKYQPKTKYYSYITTTMILLLFNLLVSSLVCIPIGKIIGDILGLDLQSVYLLLIYSFSLAVITCFNAYSSVEYKYRAFLCIAGANAISSILLSMFLIKFVFRSNSYMGRTLGTVIPSVVLSIIIVFYFLKQSRPKFANVKPFLKWGIKYSLPIIPHGISQIILAQFDRIMILKIISSSIAGLYSFAYNILSVAIVTTNSLDNVWATWLYEKIKIGDKISIRKYSTIYAGCILAYFVLIMLISPELVKILAPDVYYDSIYSVIPLITGGYFSFLYTLPAAVEYYYEKTSFIMIGTFFAAIFNVLLNLIFLKKYGYIAASYNTLITYVAYFALHFYFSKKVSRCNYFSTRYLVVFCIIILLANFCVLSLINFIWIRLSLACVITFVSIYYEEKNIGIMKKIIKKVWI